MKIKVCLLATDSTWGGTEKMIYTLVKGLDPSVYEIYLITLIGDGTLIERCSSLTQKSINLNLQSKLNPVFLWKIFRFLRKNKIQLLHAYLFHANIIGRIIGALARVPVVISSQRNTDDWRKWYHILLDRITAPFCSVIISNSTAGKERLVKYEKIKPEKIIVIPNGIEPYLQKEISSGKQMRQMYTIPQGAIIVGMTANFRPHKGHKTLIDAAKAIINQRQDVYFVLAGEGITRPSLLNEVQNLGLEKRIVLPGRVDDMNAFLSMIDIFVLSSEWEGMPVAVMEAMSVGVPVIATDVGDVPELIQDKKEGLLIEPNDPNALVIAIQWMIDHPKESTKFAENAKNKINQQFTQRMMVKQMHDCYIQCLKEKNIN